MRGRGGDTQGKYKITEKIEALRAMAYRDDEIFLRLDNAKHLVECVRGFAGHEAIWFIHQCYWDQKKKFESMAHCARMDESGMDQIARGLLNLTTARVGLLSQKHVDQIKKHILPAKG